MFQAFEESVHQEISDIAGGADDLQLESYARSVVLSRMISDSLGIEEFYICNFSGQGARKRKHQLDGYLLDECDNHLHVLVCMRKEASDQTRFSKTQVQECLRACLSAVEDLSKSDAAPDADLEPLLQMLKEPSEELAVEKIILHCAADMEVSDRSLTNTHQQELRGIPVEQQIWDLKRFFLNAGSKIGREEIEYDLVQEGIGGIPCLLASKSEKYDSYLCVATADQIADLYQKYGSRLLEANVRSFLSTKTKVNKAIQKTLADEPGQFFAYNNGLSATATSVVVKETERGQAIMSAKGLQIVNGGQTTASLATSKYKGKRTLQGATVQIKLTVLKGEGGSGLEKFVENISKCANSQNKVSDADFFANHPFHRTFETLSRTTLTPTSEGKPQAKWFYERARGQYVNDQGALTTTERKHFASEFPRKLLVSKTDLAKSETAWSGNPDEVCKGAQKVFASFAKKTAESWDSGNGNFSQPLYTQAICRIILFRRLESLIQEAKWYQGGYRAQLVAFTIAKFSDLIRQQFPDRDLDYRKIWNQQDLSQTMIEKLNILAQSVYAVILKPDEGHKNVSEWCKRPKCWKNVRDLVWRFEDSFQEQLADREEALGDQREAKKALRENDELAVMTRFIELGIDFWSKFHAEAKSRNLIPLQELAILDRHVRANWMPNGRQCKALLDRVDQIKPAVE